MKPEAARICNSKDLAEDLLGDAILIILESRKTFPTPNDVRKYCLTVMMNMVEQEFSAFNRTHARYRISESINDRMHEELPDAESPEGKLEYVNEHLVNVALDNLHWYDREILKLYAECGSYRKAEQLTLIPYCSIRKTCMKAKSQIAQLLNINV